MSATLDSQLFVDYFCGSGLCAVLRIPGRTFPIEDFSLEDALHVTGFSPRGKVLLRGSDLDSELQPLHDVERCDGEADAPPARWRGCRVPFATLGKVASNRGHGFGIGLRCRRMCWYGGLGAQATAGTTKYLHD